MTRSSVFFDLVGTRFGEVAIIWTESVHGSRITRVLLPAPKGNMPGEIRALFSGASLKPCRASAKLGKDIRAFTEGRDVSFDTTFLEMIRVPPFHRDVLRQLARIPRGRVSSYGTLAAVSGAPGGARAAGQGCAKNPFPLIYPCHRVIRSDATLGGFGGGLRLKQDLLEMEGVRFDPAGKVKKEFILS